MAEPPVEGGPLVPLVSARGGCLANQELTSAHGGKEGMTTESSGAKFPTIAGTYVSQIPADMTKRCHLNNFQSLYFEGCDCKEGRSVIPTTSGNPGPSNHVRRRHYHCQKDDCVFITGYFGSVIRHEAMRHTIVRQGLLALKCQLCKKVTIQLSEYARHLEKHVRNEIEGTAGYAYATHEYKRCHDLGVKVKASLVKKHKLSSKKVSCSLKKKTETLRGVINNQKLKAKTKSLTKGPRIVKLARRIKRLPKPKTGTKELMPVRKLFGGKQATDRQSFHIYEILTNGKSRRVPLPSVKLKHRTDSKGLFHCTLCTFKTSLLNSFWRHRVAVHDLEPISTTYYCYLCAMGTTNSFDFKRHCLTLMHLDKLSALGISGAPSFPLVQSQRGPDIPAVRPSWSGKEVVSKKRKMESSTEQKRLKPAKLVKPRSVSKHETEECAPASNQDSGEHVSGIKEETSALGISGAPSYPLVQSQREPDIPAVRPSWSGKEAVSRKRKMKSSSKRKRRKPAKLVKPGSVSKHETEECAPASNHESGEHVSGIKGETSALGISGAPSFPLVQSQRGPDIPAISPSCSTKEAVSRKRKMESSTEQKRLKTAKLVKPRSVSKHETEECTPVINHVAEHVSGINEGTDSHSPADRGDGDRHSAVIKSEFEKRPEVKHLECSAQSQTVNTFKVFEIAENGRLKCCQVSTDGLDDELNKVRADSEGLYRCMVCPFCTERHDVFLQHRVAEHDLPPVSRTFYCKPCGLRTTNLSNFKLHCLLPSHVKRFDNTQPEKHSVLNQPMKSDTTEQSLTTVSQQNELPENSLYPKLGQMKQPLVYMDRDEPPMGQGSNRATINSSPGKSATSAETPSCPTSTHEHHAVENANNDAHLKNASNASEACQIAVLDRNKLSSDVIDLCDDDEDPTCAMNNEVKIERSSCADTVSVPLPSPALDDARDNDSDDCYILDEVVGSSSASVPKEPHEPASISDQSHPVKNRCCSDVDAVGFAVLDQFTSQELLIHLHRRNRMFTCVCGTMFFDQELFKLHVVCHSRENPLTCDVCGIAAAGWESFMAHLIKH